MYNWRRLTPGQQAEVVRLRKQQRVPWHSPPHQVRVTDLYHVTAANYEHRPIIGASPQRMAAFEQELLERLEVLGATTFAWCVLPNHYHVLVQTEDIRRAARGLGKLHGRASYD